jgi:DNA-binding NarL/FixJ family response regulator
VIDAARAVGGKPEVVGRERELARVDAFLEGLPAGARALLIRGEPGIGKTALWRVALERCRRAGYRTLVTRAAEDEMSLALAGLVDLFEDDELDAEALLEDENAVARGRAVLDALRRLAASGPTVIAVDDLQWLDAPTARTLRFALRRLDAEPIGVLTTARPGLQGEDPLPVAAVLPPGRVEAADLAPLGTEALRRVIAGILTTVSRSTLRRIHETSGGNPLYAIELARGLGADARNGSNLPLPDSLQAAIARRLETVPPDLASLLETAAALGQTSVRELRRAAPGLDVETLLAAGTDHGLIVVEESLAVRFSHPLIGSVVYGRLTPLGRRELHARLATAATDPDARARHVALSTDEPGHDVAQLIEDAADRADARGALHLAAEFAAHSLRLTPADDAAAGQRRALKAITILGSAGEVTRALALADRLVATLPPGQNRAEALLHRAWVEDDDRDTGEGFLLEALEDAGRDTVLRGRILEQLGWAVGVHRGDLRRGLEYLGEALAIARGSGEPDFETLTTAKLAYLSALAGRPRPDLVERSLALEQQLPRHPLWSGAQEFLAEQVFWSGDLVEARRLFDGVRERAKSLGHEIQEPYSMLDFALLSIATGDFLVAEALTLEGMLAARDAEDTWAELLLLYPLALASAWLGRPAEAREAAGRRLEGATSRKEEPGVARARYVLGLLALSEGRHEAARDELVAAAELLDRLGFANPAAFPGLADAVEALAACGDSAGAGTLLARLEPQAARLAAPVVDAEVERCRGAVLLADGRADAAERTLETAALAFDGLGYRPDAARAVLQRGRALARDGRRGEAAEVLAEARARFAAMSAAAWEARAAAELERASPGRSAGVLTKAEESVAALVAEGLKNREIGQTLFMSVATVEAHLTRTYRKLGIRSRTELARLVAEGGVAPSGRTGAA